jgi:hypothetical protein
MTEHPYSRADYAAASMTGSIGLDVPTWDAAICARGIPGTDLRDACGPYPMLPIATTADIAHGLDAMRRAGCVSFVAVIDPIFCVPEDRLNAFDAVRHFKTHYLLDLSIGPFAPNKHHRYDIKKARKNVSIVETSMRSAAAGFRSAYATLGEKHGFGSADAFLDLHIPFLCDLPGIKVFTAVDGERKAVSYSIWFEHDGVAYNHLGASLPEGYAVGSAYALYAAAIESFSHCRILNFGGGAGSDDDPNSGLARFKRGFSNSSASARLVRTILDTDSYEDLCARARIDPAESYFPAYRRPGPPQPVGPILRETS